MHFIPADWDYASQVQAPVEQRDVLPLAVFASSLCTLEGLDLSRGGRNSTQPSWFSKAKCSKLNRFISLSGIEKARS
jgi:hypothetical protein